MSGMPLDRNAGLFRAGYAAGRDATLRDTERDRMRLASLLWALRTISDGGEPDLLLVEPEDRELVKAVYEKALGVAPAQPWVGRIPRAGVRSE